MSRRQKIFGFPPGGRGAPTIASLAGWIELAGGLLIAFGLLTRVAAFIASGEMAAAYFMVSFTGEAIGHAPNEMERILPILNKGQLPVVFCFVFFFMVFFGPGHWSIDALIRKSAAPAATA